MKRFYASQWGPGLDPEVYADRLKVLLKTGLPSLGNEDADRVVSNQFISGFPQAYAEKLRLLFAGRSPKLSEVVAAAKDLTRHPAEDVCAAASEDNSSVMAKIKKLSLGLENLVGRVSSFDTGRTRRRNEDRGRVPSDYEPRSFRRNRNQKDQVRCFNCSGFGHLARECPSPSYRPASGNACPRGLQPTEHLRENSQSSA